MTTKRIVEWVDRSIEPEIKDKKDPFVNVWYRHEDEPFLDFEVWDATKYNWRGFCDMWDMPDEYTLDPYGQPAEVKPVVRVENAAREKRNEAVAEFVSWLINHHEAEAATEENLVNWCIEWDTYMQSQKASGEDEVAEESTKAPHILLDFKNVESFNCFVETLNYAKDKFEKQGTPSE